MSASSPSSAACPNIVGGLSASLANGGLFIAALDAALDFSAIRCALLCGSGFWVARGPSFWRRGFRTALGFHRRAARGHTLRAGSSRRVRRPALPMAVKPSERGGNVGHLFQLPRRVRYPDAGHRLGHPRWSDIPAIFAITGVAMIATWMVAGLLHPRLGTRRGIRTA